MKLYSVWNTVYEMPRFVIEEWKNVDRFKLDFFPKGGANKYTNSHNINSLVIIVLWEALTKCCRYSEKREAVLCWNHE